MNTLNNIINANLPLIVILLTITCLFFIIVTIVLFASMNRVQKRADRFFGSKRDKRNLETMFAENTGKMNDVLGKYDELLLLIDNINERMTFCTQKIGLIRFNPFDTMGSDLSFALALLDEKNNGVVINTIHGRDASYTYAKPIIGGESSYTLSNEERRAIQIAMDENKIVVEYNNTTKKIRKQEVANEQNKSDDNIRNKTRSDENGAAD